MYQNSRRFTQTNYYWKSAILLMVVSWFNAITISTAEDCQYDFSPCECYYNPSGNDYSIDCGNSFNNLYFPMADVAAAFRTKPALDVSDLYLYIRSEGDSIPADLLGQSQLTGKLMIEGSFNSLLTVDSNAFRSSRNSSLSDVELFNLDTNRMDFEFLNNDFYNLSSIYFRGLSNLEKSLITLPNLTALTTLYFDDNRDSDMNNAFSDSVLKCNGLKYLTIETQSMPASLTYEGMSQLMDWLLPSSANSLEGISIGSIDVSRLPLQLASFRNLKYIGIRYNIANSMIIPSGSFFSNELEYLRIYSTRVVSVEDGAFKGNYNKTVVDLDFNSLRRFESGAFKSMLDQMANSTSAEASVHVQYNAFDCFTDPCHLAWLCRDNRHLLSRVIGANCADSGQSFESLSQDLFVNCP